MNDSEKSLYNQWLNFIFTIFHPPVIIFLICSLGLLYVNYSFQGDKKITALLSALMIFSAGLLGTFIRKRWEILTEKPHLVAKGKMAIRNLRQILSNVVYLERKIKGNIPKVEKNEMDIKSMSQILDNIIDICKVIQEECKTSIENWADIIDEADITKMTADIITIRGEIEEKEREIEQLQLEKEETEGEKNKLLEEKERELEDLRRQLHAIQSTTRKGILGGISTDISSLGTSGYPGLYGYVSHQLVRKCTNCGKELHKSGNVLLDLTPSICEDCKKQQNILGGRGLAGGS